MTAGAIEFDATTRDSLEVRRATGRWGAVSLHASWVAAVLLFDALADDPTRTLRLGGFSACAGYLLTARVEIRRSPLLLSPLTFYFLWYAVGLGLSAAHAGSLLAGGALVSFGMVPLPARAVADGYLVALVGSLALHAGIAAARPLTGGGQVRAAAESATWWRVLWIAGIATRLLAPLLKQLGNALVANLQWASAGALAGYAMTTRTLGPRQWVVLAAGTLVECVLNLRSGSKAYIMYSFLPVIWVMSRRRRLRPLLAAALALLAVLYIFVLEPVVREARRTSDRADVDHTEEISRAYEKSSWRATVTVERQVHRFLERQFDALPIAYLHEEVERYGLRLGETMHYLGYAFVPRLFYPHKPPVTRGGWFRDYLYPGQSTTSIGQTATGELYWNFGWVGVVAGMLAIGAFVGALWRMAGSNPAGDPIGMVLYTGLMLRMTDMPEAGTVVVGLTIATLFFTGLYWLRARIEVGAIEASRRAA